MAAPPGNKFWQNRTTHGRDTLFATAKLLQDEIEAYFDWCIANPLLRMEQNRSNRPPIKNEDGTVTYPDPLIGIPTARPFTLIGLRTYLDVSDAYFTNFKHGLRVKLDDSVERQVETPEAAEKRRQEAQDFLRVVTWAEDVIYNQKFEGAAVGAYNGNIIAMDLGLRSKSDVQVKSTVFLSDEPTVFE